MLTLTSKETQIVAMALGSLKKSQVESLPLQRHELQNLYAKLYDTINKSPRACGAKQYENEFLQPANK